MKKSIIFAAFAAIAFAACKKDMQDLNAGGDLALRAAGPFVDTLTLPTIINTNMTLTADKLWLIDGKTWVTNGATLTVQAGTQVEGVYKTGGGENASALIVTKTGKLRAIGKEATPVIFTSHLVGLPAGRTTRQAGDWGGIVLLGDAPTNQVNPPIEGITNGTIPAGVDASYGGSNPDHSAGVLAYVRIEWAGAVIGLNNELNSLTMGGVGKKTGLKYLMASNGLDDAFEFFGGNSEPRYLIANSQNDDAFDFDFGFSGNLQYGVSVRNAAFAYNDANGIECDNDATNSGATPTTRPQISNFTFMGRSSSALTGSRSGARFRRGTDLRVRNSIFMGYTTGIEFENTLTTTVPLFFRNNGVQAFVDSAKFVGSVSPWGASNLAVVGASFPTTWINNPAPATHAQFKSSALVYKAGGPFDPAAAGAILPNYTGLTTNFQQVPYIGALGPGAPIRDINGKVTVPNNWLAGSAGAWVNFDPQ